MIESERDSRSFERYKLLKFWSQSFLAGVPLVVVGFRNDDGIGGEQRASSCSAKKSFFVTLFHVVQSVQHLMTLEMPQFVGKKRGMWVQSLCLRQVDLCDNTFPQPTSRTRPCA